MPASSENISSLSAEDFKEKLEKVEDTYKPQPQSEEDKKELAKEEALDKYKGWKDQLEKADKIPGTQEIFNAYEGATSSERVNLTNAVLNKAFEKNPEIKGGNLGYVEEISRPPLRLENINRDPTNTERPQIWYKQITEKKGLFRKNEVPTDNVLLVSRLNNEKEQGKSMVVIKLDRQLEGKLQKEGFSTMIPEADYNRILNTEHPKLTNSEKLIKDMLEGNMTVKACEKSFKKYMGKSSDKFWEKEDERIENSGPARWRSKETYGKMLEQLENDYTEQLQLLEDKISYVEKDTKAKQEEFDKKVETVGENQFIQEIVSKFEQANRQQNETMMKLYTKMLQELRYRDDRIFSTMESFSKGTTTKPETPQIPVENQPVGAEEDKTAKMDINKVARNAEMWRNRAKRSSANQENTQVVEEVIPEKVESASEDTIEGTMETILNNAGSGPETVGASTKTAEMEKPEGKKEAFEDDEDDPFYFGTKMKKKEAEQSKEVDSYSYRDEYEALQKPVNEGVSSIAEDTIDFEKVTEDLNNKVEEAEA